MAYDKKPRPLLAWLAAVWGVGLWACAARQWPQGLFPVAFLAGLALLFKPSKTFYLLLAAFLSAFLYGGAVFESPLHQGELHHLIVEVRVLQNAALTDEQITTTARILGAWTENGQPLRLAAAGKKVRFELKGGALGWLDEKSLIRGERLRLKGDLRAPHGFANPGAVDPAVRFRRDGLWAVVAASEGPVWQLERGGMAARALNAVDTERRLLASAIADEVTADAAALESALLFGFQENLSPSLRRTFIRTGVAHVLAVSGQNFAIFMAIFFGGSLRALRRWRWLNHRMKPEIAALLLNVPVLLGLVLLCGAQPSVVRAALMGFLCLIALCLGRGTHALNILGVAALATLAADPSVLWQPSWQLSFAAVLAIVVGFERWPQTRASALRALFFMTVFATIGTLPLVVLHFGQLSLSGFAVNLIVVPVINILILPPLFLSLPFYAVFRLWHFSWAFSTAALLWKVVAFFLAVLVKGLLTVEKMPFGFIRLLPWGFWETAAFLGVGMSILQDCRPKYRRAFVAAALIFAVSVATVRAVQAFTECSSFWVEFLEVGHGDAIFVHFPGGRTMIVDGGGFAGSRYDLGRWVWLPYLRARGITRIDTVVVTHPHPDHFLGLRTLVGEYEIGELWFNGDRKGPVQWREFLGDLESAGIPRRIARAGVPPFLYPGEGVPQGQDGHSVNDRSAVLSIEIFSRRILLTGDIEQFGEQWLRRNQPFLGERPLSLLKVPHHGSQTSSSAVFLRWLRPRHAIVSAGRIGALHLPHASVVERYRRLHIPLFTTEQCGAIRYRVDAEGRERWETQRPCGAP